MTTLDATPRRRVAVLGGTGFVGRPVCRALIDSGHEVVVIARSPAKNPVQGARSIWSMDLITAPAEQIAEVLANERVEVIINAAGGMWGLRDEEMVGANLTLTQRIITAARAIGRPRLVQLGSVHEYGLVPIDTSISEDAVPAPVTEYGRLKLRCTGAVLDATRRGEVDGVTLRVGNVIGADQPRASLLGVVGGQLAQAWREGRPAVLKMDPLGSRRDFMTLADAVDAIVMTTTMRQLPARVFNIGTGRATTARAVVSALIDVSGVSTELIEASATTPAESTWQQMRVERARRLLCWSPNRALEDGLKELWASYCDGGCR